MPGLERDYQLALPEDVPVSESRWDAVVGLAVIGFAGLGVLGVLGGLGWVIYTFLI